MTPLFRVPLRQYSTMSASLSPVSSSPFTRAVVSSMRKLYPESLADKSFDNTGLLLEAPFNPARRQNNSVLLTIDITKAVADEAIKRKASVVVTYHPIIFHGLKSLTLNNTQQNSLLRLAQEGISVYSPHTAVDASPGGMGDWLCDIVTGAVTSPVSPPTVRQSSSQNYSHPIYPQPPSSISSSSAVPHVRTTIHPSPPPVPEGFDSAGMGRLVTFNTPQPLTTIIDRIAQGVGSPGGIPIAIPQGASVDTMKIRTIGVCPGSGSGVLFTYSGTLPDLLFTGELVHHETLSAIERGSVVVALAHTNTERGYLPVMRQKLAETLKKEWEVERAEGLKVLEEIAKEGGAGGVEGLEEAYKDLSCVVDISERDRDPFGIMIRQESYSGL